MSDPTDHATTDPAEARAWSWVTHLRGGGQTPWTHWSTPPAAAGSPAAPVGPGATGPRVLPGAQQMELLRQVNAEGDLSVAARDRVLAASGLDRGRTDLPLPGGPRAAFGPEPLDPADVPTEELLRVAVLLLADALPDVAAHTPRSSVPTPTLTTRLRRAAGGGYRVVGDPWLAARVRGELRRLGRPPGGRRPRVLVLGGPLPDLLARTWAHRVLHEGAPAWADWVAGQAGGALPHGADVAGQAGSWAARVGARRVVVVTDPATLRRLTGVRRLDLDHAFGPWGDRGPGIDAVDLVRRVRVALAVVAPPDRHAALLRERLCPALASLADEPAAAGFLAGPLPQVPEDHAAWAARHAVRQRRRVVRAGYCVAGDVDDLRAGGTGVVPDRPGRDVPELERVLGTAVSLLARGLVPAGNTDHGTERG